MKHNLKETVLVKINMNVKSFFDTVTSTFSHIAYSDKQSQCAIIDPVLGFDIKTGRSNTDFADEIIAFVTEKQLEVEWILAVSFTHMKLPARGIVEVSVVAVTLKKKEKERM